jgi:UDP-N-acetylglucosamine/UDP-N-acetyl-alpha-D-glucosaminouronate 4-epimerase
MPRYLVTGGAGFIGSALVRALLEEQSGEAGEVEVVDNLLTGHERNLAEVRGSIKFHNADIRDRERMIALFDGVDTVFHLAAIPSVPRSIHDPVASHEVNADGVFNVFHAAVKGRVRRVVYAASSAAYGDTPALPKSETMLPRPKSPYAVQKLLGEHYASVFHSCFGLETISLRFFNVYGPRQDPSSPYSGVLSLFMRHLLAGTPPTMFGDGEQTRDFTYVEDVAALCLKAARAAGADAAGQTYNAGNGNKYSLNFIWSLLQRIEGVRIAPVYGPPREGDVRDSMADTSAAVAALGHAPKFTIEEGLKRTLEWYRATDRAVQGAA